MRRLSIRRAAALLALALLALGLVRFLRSESLAGWLRAHTGEESWWEGVKGAGALALLELRQPELQLAPEAPMDHLGMNPFGVNTFLQLEADPENVRRSFALMQKAGIGWARQQFPWEDIEIHARGDFEDRRNEPPCSAWDKYDRIVQMAEDHGIELLVRLDDPPAWVYADPAAEGPQKGPPSDPAAFEDFAADYGKFVAEVVARYCGRVRYYQIWNEPNIYPEWGEQDVDPAGYAALLDVAATRARAACPDVVIVSAALAPTTEPGGRNMDDLKYLDALYDAGWQDSFDILAAQAFGLWTGPTDHRASPDRANFVRPTLLRDRMVRQGDAAKPVWITEMGWDSPPEAFPAPYGRVDETLRAQYTQAAYQRIAAEWPWVAVANLWFLRRPDWEWHRRPEGYFRLVEPDWGETETYLAMAGLANQYPVMRPGRSGPGHRAIQYSGPWRDAPETGRPSHKVGTETAELQLGFSGTELALWLARPDPEAEPPTLYTVLDGEPRSLTPEPDGDRWVLRFENLEDGEHVLILRVDGGEALVEELRVRAPALPGPFDPAIAFLTRFALFLLLLIAACLLAAWAWRRLVARGRVPPLAELRREARRRLAGLPGLGRLAGPGAAEEVDSSEGAAGDSDLAAGAGAESGVIGSAEPEAGTGEEPSPPG